jgi:hypothetical protein
MPRLGLWRLPAELQRAIGVNQRKTSQPVRPWRHPPATPIELYTVTVRVPIPNGVGQAAVPASGIVSIQVGPQGVGTVWYPQSAAIATTTGAADTSTCTLYVGPLALLTQVGSQSYAGGGDNIGLAVPALVPGYFIVAKWAGATPGDLATLTVYGQADVLTA